MVFLSFCLTWLTLSGLKRETGNTFSELSDEERRNIDRALKPHGTPLCRLASRALSLFAPYTVEEMEFVRWSSRILPAGTSR